MHRPSLLALPCRGHVQPCEGSMADVAIPMTVRDGFAQRRRWRAFRDPAVEASYRAWHRDQILPVARLVALGNGVIWSIMPFLFIWANGENASSRVGFVGSWAIGMPICFGAALGASTPLRRWVVEVVL